MKFFTQEEVVEKIKEFNDYMSQERKLQEELLSLKMGGVDKDAFRQASQRHDEIIEEINDLRMNKMMPIIEEMAHFVAYCEKVEKGEIKLGDPSPFEKQEETTQPAETEG